MKSDAYWDELGASWRAIEPLAESAVPRLKARLRWQARCAAAIMIVGMQLGAVGTGLGAVTIYLGWSGGVWHFVTRGLGIVVASCLLFWAAWTLRADSKAEQSALSGMLAAAAAHAEKSIRAIRVAYWVCATAAIFGVAGFFIRIRVTGPPAMSPLVWLILLALIAMVLFGYERRLQESLQRLRYLLATLAGDATDGE